MSNSFSIGDLYTALKENKIECESKLKDCIVQSIANYGTYVDPKKKDVYHWRKDGVLDIISEILADLERIITVRRGLDGADLTQDEWDFHVQARVRVYRIKRAVRELLKEEKS